MLARHENIMTVAYIMCFIYMSATQCLIFTCFVFTWTFWLNKVHGQDRKQLHVRQQPCLNWRHHAWLAPLPPELSECCVDGSPGVKLTGLKVHTCTQDISHIYIYIIFTNNLQSGTNISWQLHTTGSLSSEFYLIKVLLNRLRPEQLMTLRSVCYTWIITR